MSDQTPVTEGELTPLYAQIAALALRHGLTWASGVLVSLGALQADQQAQFVTMLSGVGMGLVALAWSAYQKYSAKRPA